MGSGLYPRSSCAYFGMVFSFMSPHACLDSTLCASQPLLEGLDSPVTHHTESEILQCLRIRNEVRIVPHVMGDTT